MSETKKQLIARLRKRADEFEANRKAGKVYTLKNINSDLTSQFENSLKDLQKGKFKRLA